MDNMSSAEFYNDIGGDSITITEIMNALGLMPDELSDATRFNRFKEVVEFLKTKENYNYLIKKLITGKQIDHLQYVWEWTKLQQNKDEAKKIVEEKKQMLDSFGTEVDPDLVDSYQKVKSQFDDAVKELNNTADLIKRYE